jgi:Fe-Mn family superoxide dismutase
VKYSLPDLPYDYSALEPHISGEIIELHHDRHHAAYVAGANATTDRLAEARAANDFSAIVGLEKTLAFNLSGHVLHGIYWQNLSPDGGATPEGDFADALDDSFGSFDAFKAELTSATTTVQGSGWGVLAWDPMARRLFIEQIYDHQSNVGQGAAPLFVIDAWEHAFYLQYHNVKADYVNAVWELVSWPDIAARWATAAELTGSPTMRVA